MVFIQKNKENYFISRLGDKRTLPTTYFLWKVTNIFSKESVYFLLDDLSNYQCDYSMFNLVEDASGSTTGGINVPQLFVGGQYEYEVYETTEESLDPTYVIGSYLERDIFLVEIDKTVNTSGSEINNIYY